MLDQRQLDEAASADPAGLVASLLSISKAVRALMGVKLAELGLHPGQDEFLLALKDGAPQTISHLAERLSVRPSTVSKMKERLIEQGMVAQSASATDARNTLVQLTPRGLELAARVQTLHLAIEKELGTAVNGRGGDLLKATTQIEDVLARRLRRLR